MLNNTGYGKDETGLILNLVYNPAGAFLPPSQNGLEKEYKVALKQKFDITFNQLFTITNIPINRFLDYLVKSAKYESYMETLVNAYNPVSAANVMCRNTISIGWDGYLYDCDFNQMLEMKVGTQSNHISTFNIEELNKRNILIGQHCYGCTAGAGSSCGGEVLNK
jgi:radical SAM/Cys-rich protein